MAFFPVLVEQTIYLLVVNLQHARLHGVRVLAVGADVHEKRGDETG